MLGTSVAFAIGCTGEVVGTEEPGAEPAAHTENGSTVAALSLGATGPAVAELQDHLMHYGYFPNDGLVERFPDWVSVTAVSPEAGVFDEATEDAVRAFQARNGLEATGVVGPETHRVMDQARCGNPDSFEHDAESKFAISRNKWSASKRNFTWKAIDPSLCQKWNGSKWIPCFSASNPAPATREQLRQLALSAFARWGAETDITFTEATGTTDISLAWAEFHERDCSPKPTPEFCRHGIVANPSHALAMAVTTFVTTTREIVRGDIVFNFQLPMTPQSPVPAGVWDMQALTLHEVGHALGIDHSSADRAYGVMPVMQPSIAAGPGQLRSLTFDDATAISTRYDKWNTRPGQAWDIAAGGDGSFWHIGTAATGDGFRIYKWNSVTSGWEEASGNGGAVRIAVGPDGTPWVTTATGAVFNHSRNHREGGWHHIPNLCALDIGVGGDGSVWFVTCNQDNEGGVVGGYKVGKLVIVPLTADSAWIGIHEVPGSTHATRISVGKNGHPWMVTLSGDVFWGDKDPAVRAWNHVSNMKAADISLSPRDYAYVTGTGANVGRLYILNYQPEVRNDKDEILVPGRNEWYELARLPTGTPNLIAAGERTVWATNTSKAMFQQTAK